MANKYEISVWEDIPYTSGEYTYFDERKIAVIGADTITANCRAIEPRLTRSINGEITFTFKMIIKCGNTESEIESFAGYLLDSNQSYLLDSQNYYLMVSEDSINDTESTLNPFLDILINERKIKVFFQDEWYDLLIKDISESSEENMITYTCKSLYVNELGKTGFNLEFDTELENNQGTAQELAEKILEGSGWYVNKNKSDLIRQTTEEIVYNASVQQSFSAHNDTLNESVTIGTNARIKVFYSCINKKTSFFQFLYSSSNFEYDGTSQLIINAYCCSLDNVTYATDGEYVKIYYNNNYILKVSTSTDSIDSRGDRLVKSQKTVNDPLTKKTVNVYKNTQNNHLIYGYSYTEFNDATNIVNLVGNNSNFASTAGWDATLETEQPIWKLYPDYKSITSPTEFSSYSGVSYLRIPSGNGSYGDNYTSNNGIYQNTYYLDNGFIKGEKYVFRYKGRLGTLDSPSDTYITKKNTNESYIKPCIGVSTINSYGHYVYSKENLFTILSTSEETSTHWINIVVQCNTTIAKKQIITNNIRLFLQASLNSNTTYPIYWLENVQFFKYINNNGSFLKPEELETSSLETTVYKYYDHTLAQSSGWMNEEDINYYYEGTTPLSDLETLYNDNFEKIGMITGRQSNRFNLLQSIAETFECWVCFGIEHNSIGKTVIKNGVPHKYVYFKNQVGEFTGLSFIYGIDLKSITRTINSDAFVTKTIVLPNSNEFATNKFCTIARSNKNPTLENFILNFDYYINHGLINEQELNNDLYSTNGYYNTLRQKNSNYDETTNKLANLRAEQTRYEALITTYKGYITSLTDEIKKVEQNAMDLAGVTKYSNVIKYIQKEDNKNVKTYVNNRELLKRDLANYTSYYNSANSAYTSITSSIKTLETQNETLAKSIEAVHSKFLKKYAPYIQEGYWSSDDYYDDDKYYYDAVDVAYTSSRPQVSYSISVYRVSALEEFKNKIFRIGDIGYVEDTEFFGYTYIGDSQIKTPYKEKIIISEITVNFDSPEEDSITVQNYKTQFEDLFQRINATVQQLQYTTASYKKVSSIVDEDGIITSDSLQNALNKNKNIVTSAASELVVYNNTGITCTDSQDPNKIVRVTSGGIFCSNDGGESYINAIRGDGISADVIQAGSISVGNISIFGESSSIAPGSFRWDSNGITAYSQNGTTTNGAFDPYKFVRFDQYGIYGIKGNTEFKPTKESDIKDSAQFGLIWSGFFMKSTYGDGGAVEVSNGNNILVTSVSNNTVVNRVKIGRLNSSSSTTGKYGIELYNKDGNKTFCSDSTGDLWIENSISIGTSGTTSKNQVRLGRLSEPNSSGVFRVMSINNDSFTIDSDGSFKCTQGDISGTINATNGAIGGWVINPGQLISSSGKLKMLSSNGDIEMYENGILGMKLTESKMNFYCKNNKVPLGFSTDIGGKLLGSYGVREYKNASGEYYGLGMEIAVDNNCAGWSITSHAKSSTELNDSSTWRRVYYNRRTGVTTSTGSNELCDVFGVAASVDLVGSAGTSKDIITDQFTSVEHKVGYYQTGQTSVYKCTLHKNTQVPYAANKLIYKIEHLNDDNITYFYLK